VLNLETLTLSELCKREWSVAVVVISADSFDFPYSLEARSYEVLKSDNYFQDGKISNSMYGDSLDKSDLGVRLDHYIHNESHDKWKVDHCWIVY
jgi:hypothetical protein